MCPIILIETFREKKRVVVRFRVQQHASKRLINPRKLLSKNHHHRDWQGIQEQLKIDYSPIRQWSWRDFRSLTIGRFTYGDHDVEGSMADGNKVNFSRTPHYVDVYSIPT